MQDSHAGVLGTDPVWSSAVGSVIPWGWGYIQPDSAWLPGECTHLAWGQASWQWGSNAACSFWL